jgi:hypothetical protein
MFTHGKANETSPKAQVDRYSLVITVRGVSPTHLILCCIIGERAAIQLINRLVFQT